MSFNSKSDENNKRNCIATQVDFACDRLGISLTSSSREDAINNATSAWEGTVKAGDATRSGINHTVGDIIDLQ